MVEKAASGFWATIEGIAKMWPVIVGITVLIGGVYSLMSKVDDMQATLAGMNNLPSRVQALEAAEANMSTNFSPQVATLQASQHDTNASLIGITQNIATLQAQMQFLIAQNWPNAKVSK
jgi:outer membrane murein-binding lipoprotein Lpp